MVTKIGMGIFEYSFIPGLIMGGYSARAKPSIGTHDPITARAVIFDSGASQVLLVEIDVVGLDLSCVNHLKIEFSQKYHIPKEHILIGIIHTHSSVLNINLFTHPSPEVRALLDDGIRKSVEMAFHSIQDATIELFSGEIDKVSFNRRDWDKLSDIINKEVIALKIIQNGHLTGIIYNWSCHPVVMGPENLELSADWPYFTQEYIRNQFNSPNLFVMFLQGTPGNLNPRNVTMGGPTKINTFKDCQEIGHDVGMQLMNILNKNGEILSFDQIKGQIADVDLPLDDPDKAEFFSEFAQIVQIQGVPFVRTVVQSFKLGSLGVAALPGEIFSENGLNIKNAQIFPHTMVIGYANDYIGYAGPKAVYEVGGYEMGMMSMSPEEGPLLEDAVINLLKKVK